MLFKTFNIVMAAILFPALISCGLSEGNSVEIVDGIKVYKNGNYPSKMDLSIKAELQFVLNRDVGDTTAVIRRIGAIDMDDKGNIFILDTRKNSVFKFSVNGDFIESFGRKGSGPGEIMWPRELLCSNDSVYVVDQRSRKIIVYDSACNYIKDITPVRENGVPQSVAKLSEDKFVGIIFGRSGSRGSGGEMQFTYNLSMLNKKFEKTKDIVSKTIEMHFRDFIPEDHLNSYTTGNGRIYVAENSEGMFSINIYDKKGVLTEKIRKNYARVLYSEKERKRKKEAFESQYRWREIDASKFRYKKAVRQLYFHKDGYLFAEGGKKRDDEEISNFIVDVFKDGLYLNTVDINAENPDFYHNPDGFEKYLIGDRLFVYNSYDNEIFVYELKIF
ncbi:MAG: 6-bladed beta-propeller [Candidatus Delongbacteria bacterium]